LLPAAIEAGVPVFCVCRGFQELNVAMGGTLHQHVEEVAGFSDHRAAHGAPLAVQYGPAHTMRVVPGGVLSHLLDEQEFFVNSLHSQGIERLAPPLRPEAVAPDGLIEAVSLPTAKAFLLGVQWHPEWLWAENPVSRAIYAAFGAAARTFSQTRNA
ncbi:MAG: gamma-glutamyl-gamma-aminobutyrate hydrolase family protein, partial [Alphaproteobacteria bacterium]|nr:gamma-glutamyl-gamma-aminobutyrate hydrolase family protein [Alphaproteobacteria bacterium]